MLRALLFCCGLMLLNPTGAVSEAGPEREALIIVGMQESHFPGGLTDPARPAARQAGHLLQEFRKSGELVLHVACVAPSTADPFVAEVAPEKGEPVLVASRPNPFLGTPLLDTLREHGIAHLVVCGMQAHVEVEATVRGAADLEFQCTLISDACHSGDMRWRTQTLAGSDLLLGTVLTVRRHYGQVLTVDAWLADH